MNIVVEGESDREMAKAVVRHSGHPVNKIRVAGGKTRLDPLIPKYNLASAFEPWVIFRDSDAECALNLRSRLLAGISCNSGFLLRIACSMSESWLLADAEAFASHFGVQQARLPRDPDSLPHAKRTLLQLCEASRSARVRRDMTAGQGQTGPLYVECLNAYASQSWRPAIAAESSESLRRAILRLREVA